MSGTIQGARLLPPANHVNLLDTPVEQRAEAARQMGAVNVDPPLPHSSHLKIIATGRVLPWNPLLAAQNALVQNCDAEGNTDPAAWQPTVKETADDFADTTLRDARWVSQAAAMRNQRKPSDFISEDIPSAALGETPSWKYENDTKTYDEMARLLRRINQQ